MSEVRSELFKKIPGVDRVLELLRSDAFSEDIPRTVVVAAVRSVLEQIRKSIQEGTQDIDLTELTEKTVVSRVKAAVKRHMTPNLRPVINATGVVVHTNLGRSLLSREAVLNLTTVSEKYSNLEFDLEEGRRGSRYAAVEDLLCEISGAQSAMVVNNNAGAVFLCLETLAKGKKAIVSRGELVEIGGSFRIPEVMAKSGAILREVGTTNRTHPHDYEGAIENDTGLLLKVHTSNYSIVGFSKSVSLEELVLMGNRYHIPVMEDLGSGTFVDFSLYGMIREPTVQESVKAGADIVTFSGDKLLGGPQAGIILGKKTFVDQIKKNPLNRALRIDKLTLAALESTLRLYRDPRKAMVAIPTLRMLTLPIGQIENKAMMLQKQLENIKDDRIQIRLLNRASRAGGGSLPLLEIPSKCLGVTVAGMSANVLEIALRHADPPVIGRIENDLFLMDLRTVDEEDLFLIKKAFINLLQQDGP